MLGEDGVEQEARIAAARAARRFDPAGRHAGLPFGLVATQEVKRHLYALGRQHTRKAAVWGEMPRTGDDDEQQIDPADHRRADDDNPAFGAWFAPDYCQQRQCLDWTERLVLYLRAVEGWTFTEVGAWLGMTATRARLTEEEAVRKLAAFRVARRREAHHQHAEEAP